MNQFLQKVLRLFQQIPDVVNFGFLSAFFKTTPEDFTDAEEVSLDIVRSDEDVAPVLRDYKTGAVAVRDDIYTNKKIKPPFYSLERPVDLFDLMKRQPGESEYAEVGDWWARLVKIIQGAFNKIYPMFKRSIEVQASQIMQTGTLSLNDENGKPAYVLDFKPKASHFPVAAIKWSESTATPLKDISSVADQIRDDFGKDANTLIMGDAAFDAFIGNASVQKCFEKDKLNLGALSPSLVNAGGKYQGYVDIGAYRYDIYTYNGRYKDFATGTKTRYMDSNKVVVTCSPDDLDFRLVFGGIPTVGMDVPFSQIIPDTVTIDGRIRINNRVYKDEKGDTYVAESKIRPICIPASIDGFGCMTVLA